MQFRQLNQITECDPGVSLTAVRRLSADEDYLQDHFPRFPVMPGVLMLEAMYQAAAWLIRAGEDFAHAAVLLKEARNVKYADFVQPGQELVVQATVVKQKERTVTVKVAGTIDGKQAVSARLVLEPYDVAELCPSREAMDPWTRREMKKEFEELCQPQPAELRRAG